MTIAKLGYTDHTGNSEYKELELEESGYVGSNSTLDDQQDTGASASKMLTQEQVNSLIGREKKEAAEKAQRAAEAKFQAELEALRAQQAPQSMGGISQLNFEDLYSQIEQRFIEKAQQQQQQLEEQARQDELKKIADTYFEKMTDGVNTFDDFDEVMRDFKPAAFPEVVYLVSEMDNVPQIMYELAKNPSKLADVYSLAKADPNMAKRALKKLADSISLNEQAKEEYIPVNPPLSKPKPSSVSTDKGYNSVRDFKNASWLKN